MEKEVRTYIYYLRGPDKHPVACVASRQVGDVVLFALSTRNPLDQWNRATARNKALGRLMRSVAYMENALTDRAELDPPEGWFVLPEHDGLSTKASILQIISYGSWFPARARKAAKLWLKTQRFA